MTSLSDYVLVQLSCLHNHEQQRHKHVQLWLCACITYQNKTHANTIPHSSFWSDCNEKSSCRLLKSPGVLSFFSCVAVFVSYCMLTCDHVCVITARSTMVSSYCYLLSPSLRRPEEFPFVGIVTSRSCFKKHAMFIALSKPRPHQYRPFDPEALDLTRGETLGIKLLGLGARMSSRAFGRHSEPSCKRAL